MTDLGAVSYHETDRNDAGKDNGAGELGNMAKFRDVRSWWLVLGLVGVLGGCGRRASPTSSAPPLQGVKLVVAAVGDTAVLPVVTAQRVV